MPKNVVLGGPQPSFDVSFDVRSRGNPRGLTTEERFWEKVEKTEYCWNWTGARVGSGDAEKSRYGRFATSTTRGNVVLVLAHRFSWELHFGPIPGRLQVLHACDNPACVNPDHLLLGTHKANMADAVAKGRMAHQRKAAAGRSSASSW